MAEFCDYLAKTSVKCRPCVENGIGACHVKLGEQEYYQRYGLTDTIQIIRHNYHLTVETDIEVKYKTGYPKGRLTFEEEIERGLKFSEEVISKEKRLRDYLGPKLPIGVKFIDTHQHYFPDTHDPEMSAFHIHVRKWVDDLDEAAVLVERLVETIKPREIEAAIA